MLKKNCFPAPRNESGFILAYVMFFLAVCTLLGIAAMNTTVDELDITTNEVIAKRVFTLAGSGLPLAIVPLLTTQGLGNSGWTNGVYLNDDDPKQFNTAGGGAIQIVKADFLQKNMDGDLAYKTGWNNWDKYHNAPDATHAAAYKPIDDPFGDPSPSPYNGDIAKLTAAKVAAGINVDPCLKIRTNSSKDFNGNTIDSGLTIDVDVDKGDRRLLAGGVAEFGSGAEGGAGIQYKTIYVLDCKATLPGKNMTTYNKNNPPPTDEMILGYRFIPNTGY